MAYQEYALHGTNFCLASSSCGQHFDISDVKN